MVKLVWNNAQRANHQNFAKKTHPCAKKNLVPKAVLMKSGLVLVNTARQVNSAYSKTTINAVRPMQSTNGFTRSRRIDSGFSRHMTGNMSYLTNYEEIDGGYVAFEGNPKGGKITRKCTIKTSNLDFENLSDESQVLLRVTRKNNMYSVDLKNIVPKGGLTFLFAKSISDESKLWHRRLGHLNFKTMNKLVKGNLVRGLPSKLFENDQTCVACQKGKQHRASWNFETIYCIARTPQQNRVAERRNRTLIEAARTMLDDSKLPTTFWAEAVNTACLCAHIVVIKASFEFSNRYNKIVEENLHIVFSESIPNAVSSRPDWLFDIDALTRTMNYEPIVAGTQSNGFAGTKASDNASQARKETENLVKDYILLPLWTADPPYSQDTKSSYDDGSKPSSDDRNKVDEDPRKDSDCNDQEKEDNVNSINNVNAASTNEVNVVGGKTSIELLFDLDMPAFEDNSIFDFTRDDEDDGVVADMNNLDTTIQVSPIPTTRIHKDHPLDQVIGDLQSATQTRKMSKNLEEHGFVSTIQQRTNHKDLQNCLFACFLSQEEPKKVIHALKDPSWIEAMQEELLQFKLQEV
ncbi:putative ribonuclease H-like domain-containing protein [Tanacetum coccineum]|uniref:Ribonuclease H-like domain-containing protein n=1 Tax=Tanacetum coccineum TaxID=301880 RepID=A0ABQ5HFD6_9ASTR